jgi:uncharacterized protein YcfJ
MKNLLVNPAVGIALLTAAVAFTEPAYAERGRADLDYAQVVKVQPIVQTIGHRIPTETCWTERVRNERPVYRDRNDSLVGTVVGGVIGGAIGNAVGHHKPNKRVGAAVGALLGATIGHDATRSHGSRYTESYYTHERRCETQYDTEYSEETVGYWVTYNYLGHQHRTRMDQDPGDKIRVRVTVEPL